MIVHSDRLGPRPLALHASALWRAQVLALSAAATGGNRYLDAQPAGLADIQTDGMAAKLALLAATQAETASRWSAFWRGVGLYRSHPYRRRMEDRQTALQVGRSRLLAVEPGDNDPSHSRPPCARSPILMIPSLVNSSDVLDLMPDRSLVEALHAAGYAPYLVDWGDPEPDAADWPVERYLDEKLAPMLDWIIDRRRAAPVVLGYCMGGLLAAALATVRPKDVRALTLLAMPWDFHAPDPEPAKRMARFVGPFQQAARESGSVPVDLLQTLFFALDPTLAARKFRNFAKLDQSCEAAMLFVAMEDWVNGGPDLAAPVAATVLNEWYGANAPMRGRWAVGGTPVTNRTYPGPTLIAAPTRDRIVPMDSAIGYLHGAANAELLRVDGGHVGMLVGDRAETALWRPLLAWIADADR